jgi:hypothetical protein
MLVSLKDYHGDFLIAGLIQRLGALCGLVLIRLAREG